MLILEICMPTRGVTDSVLWTHCVEWKQFRVTDWISFHVAVHTKWLPAYLPFWNWRPEAHPAARYCARAQASWKETASYPNWTSEILRAQRAYHIHAWTNHLPTGTHSSWHEQVCLVIMPGTSVAPPSVDCCASAAPVCHQVLGEQHHRHKHPHCLGGAWSQCDQHRNLAPT